MAMIGRHEDMTGRRFGRLVCLSFQGSDDNGLAMWKVRCDCGREFMAYRVNMIQGRTTSCGCWKSEKLIIRNRNGKGKERNTGDRVP